GLLALDADGADRLPAFPVTAVDETASGDAFNGALAAAMDAGLPWDEALRWGRAAGALAATVAGAQPSLPTRAAFDGFLAGRGEDGHDMPRDARERP
ncbi:MAG: hypothetical protein JSW65_05430, partial [Candidatus Bipolaricaulota bacterium]